MENPAPFSPSVPPLRTQERKVLSKLNSSVILALTWMQRFVETAGHNYSAPFWMGEFGITIF